MFLITFQQKNDFISDVIDSFILVKLPGRFFPGSKLYVDPTTYNEVDTAVQEFAFELDQKSLKIGHLLGGGEFADVYKGTLFKNGKSKEVAIKTLKVSKISYYLG